MRLEDGQRPVGHVRLLVEVLEAHAVGRHGDQTAQGLVVAQGEVRGDRTALAEAGDQDALGGEAALALARPVHAATPAAGSARDRSDVGDVSQVGAAAVTLVHRGERTLVELVPGSLTPATGAAGPVPAPVEDLGVHTLVGEIVDSKCWLGVMNPGNLRTHRACATLCIRGGIPPILVVRDGEGRTLKPLLVGPAGEALNEAVLPLVALPVEVEGELERRDDLLVLRAAPADIARVGEDP